MSGESADLILSRLSLALAMACWNWSSCWARVESRCDRSSSSSCSPARRASRAWLSAADAWLMLERQQQQGVRAVRSKILLLCLCQTLSCAGCACGGERALVAVPKQFCLVLIVSCFEVFLNTKLTTSADMQVPPENKQAIIMNTAQITNSQNIPIFN